MLFCSQSFGFRLPALLQSTNNTISYVDEFPHNLVLRKQDVIVSNYFCIFHNFPMSSMPGQWRVAKIISGPPIGPPSISVPFAHGQVTLRDGVRLSLFEQNLLCHLVSVISLLGSDVDGVL